MSKAASPRKGRRLPSRAPVYSWGEGFKPPIEAEVFALELARLKQELGRVPEAEDLVRVAKSSASPLHACFQWNVNKAAEAHWLDTARRLMGHLRVTFTGGGMIETPLRAYVRVREDDGTKAYLESQVALATPRHRESVLSEALRDLRIYVGRYARLLRACGAMTQATELEAAIAAALDA